MAIITFGAVAGNWSDPTKWVGGVKPVAGDDVLFIATSAACAINEDTAHLKSLDMTGYLATLSGGYSITIRGLTASTNVCKIVGKGTWTGTLYFSPVSSTSIIQVTTNGNLLNNIFITSGAAVSLVVLQDNLTFAAAKGRAITLTERGLDVNGFTLTGNSAINRLLITSNTLGTSTNRSISNVLPTTFNNVDFRDINFITAGNLDLTNGQVNSIGDCGGNVASGGTLTFTTAATQTVTGNSANWSVANWGAGRVPLPQDNAVISLTAGQTLIEDMPRVGGISFATATNLILGSTVISHGSINFTGAGTFNEGAQGWVFGSSARSGTISLISASVIFGICNFSMAGTAILSLDDAFFATSIVVCASTNSLNLNNYTHTFSKSSGTPFTGAGTITDNGSTIVYSDTGASSKTFAGGGKSYGNFSVLGGGAGPIIITSNNTFSTVTINGPKTIQFTDTSVQIVTSLVTSGTGITLTGTGVAGWAINDTSGINSVSNCTISYSTAGGGAGWKAYSNQGNIDAGNNSGWSFINFLKKILFLLIS